MRSKRDYFAFKTCCSAFETRFPCLLITDSTVPLVLEQNADGDQLGTGHPVEVTDHEFEQLEDPLLHCVVFLGSLLDEEGQSVLRLEDEVVGIVRAVDVVDTVQDVQAKKLVCRLQHAQEN